MSQGIENWISGFSVFFFMEKQEKLFKEYRGIIVFYILVAILSFLITKRIENINSQAQDIKEVRTYYA